MEESRMKGQSIHTLLKAGVWKVMINNQETSLTFDRDTKLGVAVLTAYIEITGQNLTIQGDEAMREATQIITFDPAQWYLCVEFKPGVELANALTVVDHGTWAVTVEGLNDDHPAVAELLSESKLGQVVLKVQASLTQTNTPIDPTDQQLAQWVTVTAYNAAQKTVTARVNLD
ncbi:MAG: hypothetical protein WC480_04525 [Patescibacteria group bacterium]